MNFGRESEILRESYRSDDVFHLAHHFLDEVRGSGLESKVKAVRIGNDLSSKWFLRVIPMEGNEAEVLECMLEAEGHYHEVEDAIDSIDVFEP